MTDNKRPRPLWNAIIALYVQAVLNAFAALLLLWAASEEADHGREAPELSVLGYLSLVIVVMLLAGAIMVTNVNAWFRGTARPAHAP